MTVKVRLEEVLFTGKINSSLVVKEVGSNNSIICSMKNGILDREGLGAEVEGTLDFKIQERVTRDGELIKVQKIFFDELKEK